MKIQNSFASFSVDDIPTAKAFYGETLGTQTAEMPEGLELTLPNTRVFIYPKQNHAPATFTVLNFEVEDIDSAVDELTAKGVMFEQYDEPMMKTDEKGICRNDGVQLGPAAIAWFKDPAGNFLALIQE